MTSRVGTTVSARSSRACKTNFLISKYRVSCGFGAAGSSVSSLNRTARKSVILVVLQQLLEQVTHPDHGHAVAVVEDPLQPEVEDAPQVLNVGVDLALVVDGPGQLDSLVNALHLLPVLRHRERHQATPIRSSSALISVTRLVISCRNVSINASASSTVSTPKSRRS